MDLKPYAGNGRPFVYAMYAPEDRASVEPVLSAMQEKRYEIWASARFDRRRMKKAALVLFFLTPAAAASETVNRAIGYAAQSDHPMLAVHLLPTEQTPAQRLLLNTQQAILRYECASEPAFFEKLFGSQALQNLQVTPAQKRAASLTTWGISGGVLAAAALAVVLALGIHAEVPKDSLLAGLGYGGRMADITQIYIYGAQTSRARSRTSYTGTVYDWERQRWVDRVFFDTADGDVETGGIDDVSDFAQLKNLEQLAVAGNQISDVSPLFGLRKLKFLDIAGNPVGDLTGIGSLDALETLCIAKTDVTSLSPLSGCKSLREVYVDVGQYAAFAGDGATYAFDLIEVGPKEDLLHFDTYLVGGAEEPIEPKRPYFVFLRTLSWAIYDDYTYEVFKNGEPVRIDRVENTTVFAGRADDEVDLWLNRDDFGSYDPNAEYLLVVHYQGANATYAIWHQQDEAHENPMCPELISYSGF
ncbi:MAG: hypothetical protein GX417_13470 [Clostridiales bacterium]|nr:hypothetical protein [Clostridiales bacterium]